MSQYRSKYVKPQKDERTRFDKWLDQSILDKRNVWFLMYDSEEISCRVVQVDRYMVQVNEDPEHKDEVLTWLNKGAILKAGLEEVSE